MVHQVPEQTAGIGAQKWEEGSEVEGGGPPRGGQACRQRPSAHPGPLEAGTVPAGTCPVAELSGLHTEGEVRGAARVHRQLCGRLRAEQTTGANAPGNQIPSPAHRAPAASEDHETPAPQVRWTELSTHTGSWAEDGECLHSSFYWYFTHKVWHTVKHYDTDTRKKQ